MWPAESRQSREQWLKVTWYWGLSRYVTSLAASGQRGSDRNRPTSSSNSPFAVNLFLPRMIGDNASRYLTVAPGQKAGQHIAFLQKVCALSIRPDFQNDHRHEGLRWSSGSHYLLAQPIMPFLALPICVFHQIT